MDRRALLNDSEEAFRLGLDGRQSTLWTAMPGIVKSVNFSQMTVEVQPAIQGSVTNDANVTTYVNLPLLVDVPICFPSAGGFTITLPIAIDDEVLVIIASRCIDAWWQQGGIQIPMEMRMHDLSDGFAIPGPKSLPNVIPSISTTGAQIRNNSGTTYIEIAADGKIKLVSPSSIEITGDLNVSGDVKAGTVSLKTHVHSGVTVGTGVTGGPV